MPRKAYDYHFIYKTINMINNKYYIGMHSTNNLKDGYIGSGSLLAKSIKKYGRENFSIEILEFHDNRESTRIREKDLVTIEVLNDPMCMNLRLGGDKGNFGTSMPNRKSPVSFSESHRKNISIANTGKLSGIPKTESHKKSLADVNTGKKALSSTKDKMSESHKKVWDSGRRKRKIINKKPAYFRKIYQYTLDHELIRIWNSTKEIFEELKYNRRLISQVTRKTEIYDDFKWSYTEIK